MPPAPSEAGELEPARIGLDAGENRESLLRQRDEPGCDAAGGHGGDEARDGDAAVGDDDGGTALHFAEQGTQAVLGLGDGSGSHVAIIAMLWWLFKRHSYGLQATGDWLLGNGNVSRCRRSVACRLSSVACSLQDV